MELFISVLLLILGLIIIIKGGDWFVDAASWAAEASGIPKLIVGATVVSVATTLPELIVSVIAAVQARISNNVSHVDMAIGNAIGSVTANLGLILGIALVCIPSVIKRRDYALKMSLMLAASAIIVITGYSVGSVGIISSILLIIIFAVAVYDNVHLAVKAVKCESSEELVKEPLTKKIITINIVKFIIGAAGIVIGAKLLVDNGQSLALAIGVPERIISVTIIAVGTSLPELITTVTAIAKKQASLSAGNIIGANIIDLTLILPVCTLIYGDSLPVTPQVASADLPACLIMGVASVVPSLITKKFSRWQGFLLLGLYLSYLIITCFVI